MVGQTGDIIFGKNQPGVANDMGISPLSEPITGTSQAIASMRTRPNCSFQLDNVRDGSTRTSSLCRNGTISAEGNAPLKRRDQQCPNPVPMIPVSAESARHRQCAPANCPAPVPLPAAADRSFLRYEPSSGGADSKRAFLRNEERCRCFRRNSAVSTPNCGITRYGPQVTLRLPHVDGSLIAHNPVVGPVQHLLFHDVERRRIAA